MPPVPEYYEEKYVSWSNFLRDYRKIHAKIKTNPERIYVVIGDSESFVWGQKWILSEDLYDGIRLIKDIDEFNPEEHLAMRGHHSQRIKLVTMYRPRNCVDGVYNVPYKDYMRKIVMKSLDKDEENAKQIQRERDNILQVRDKLNEIIRRLEWN
jgi:hypothetical protein